jgi:hypothetical protein
LGKEEAAVYRGQAARLNSMSQDCPDLEFPIKSCSREVGEPERRGHVKSEEGGEVFSE